MGHLTVVSKQQAEDCVCGCDGNAISQVLGMLTDHGHEPRTVARRVAAAVRAELADSRFEVVVVVFRAGTDGGERKAPSRSRLTRRERQVAVELGKGASNKQIASRLDMSVHTTRHHVERVLAKLGVRSRSGVGVRLQELLETETA